MSDNVNLGALIVSIGADITKLQDGLVKANAEVKGTSNNMDKLTLGIAAAWALAGTAIIGTLGKMIEETVAYGDEIVTASAKTGVATETLSRLKFVADQTESSFASVVTGLKFLGKNIFEASQGNDKLATTFKNLGIDIRDSNGKLATTDSVFIKLADRFKNMDESARKTAIAMDLFGRSGVDLIPILNLGSEGIQELSDRADELGIVLTAENALKIKQFSDNMKELKAAMSGLSIEIASAFIPALDNAITKMTEAIKTSRSFIDDLASGDLFKMLAENAGLAEPSFKPDPNKQMSKEDLFKTQGDTLQGNLSENVMQDEIKKTEDHEAAKAAIIAKSNKDTTRIIAQELKARQTLQEADKNIQLAGLDFLSTMVQAFGKESKLAFFILKAIRAAEIIVNSAAAAMNISAVWAWNPPVEAALLGKNATLTALSLATVAATAIAGFAQGTDSVPSMLTPGEMVVPRDFSDAIRAGDLTLGGPSGNQVAGGTNEIHITVNATVNSEIDIKQLAQQLGFETDRELRYLR